MIAESWTVTNNGVWITLFACFMILISVVFALLFERLQARADDKRHEAMRDWPEYAAGVYDHDTGNYRAHIGWVKPEAFSMEAYDLGFTERCNAVCVVHDDNFYFEED